MFVVVEKLLLFLFCPSTFLRFLSSEEVVGDLSDLGLISGWFQSYALVAMLITPYIGVDLLTSPQGTVYRLH